MTKPYLSLIIISVVIKSSLIIFLPHKKRLDSRGKTQPQCRGFDTHLSTHPNMGTHTKLNERRKENYGKNTNGNKNNHNY